VLKGLERRKHPNGIDMLDQQLVKLTAAQAASNAAAGQAEHD